MPHQCTNCGRAFDDGSKEMLSGCPDCGGNKFQFQPSGAGESADAGGDPADGTGDPPDPPERPGDAVSRTVGSAAATVRDLVGGGAGSGGTDGVDAEPTGEGTADSGIVDAGARTPETGENAAQADARSAVVEADELPPAADAGSADAPDGEVPSRDAGSPPDAANADPPTDRTAADAPDAERTDRPDLAELREELNDQFESIRVVAPGRYELNLMELYDREEYIIALQEDGRYSIRVPETIGEIDA